MLNQGFPLYMVSQNQEPAWVFYGMVSLLGVVYLISFVCLWKLWQQPVSVIKRLCWSIVLLLPLFGPIFYGAWFRWLSVQPEDQRARGRYY